MAIQRTATRLIHARRTRTVHTVIRRTAPQGTAIPATDMVVALTADTDTVISRNRMVITDRGTERLAVLNHHVTDGRL